MNARQVKKKLTKRIELLERDNNTMKRVISNSPTMQEMYDLYNKPLNVNLTHTPLQHYRVCRPIDYPIYYNDETIKHLTSESIAKGLIDIIEEHMVFETTYANETRATFDLWLK